VSCDFSISSIAGGTPALTSFQPMTTDKTTYAIVADPDSEFDKSLRWFLVNADRQSVKGLNLHRSAIGYPPESIWRLCQALENFYAPDEPEIPEGLEH
jgi:hypothetical protein